MPYRTCAIPGCDNELSANARMRTCSNCRQNLHTWERRRPAEILERSHRLRLYTSRMNTFAAVKDDEVVKIDRVVLEQKKIMSFPLRRSKQRAKAAVVEFKMRDRNKRKVNG